jgi:hypothetical protein
MDPRFLDLGIIGDVWSVSLPGRFTPEEKAPGTHCIRGWVGSKNRSGRREEKNS